MTALGYWLLLIVVFAVLLPIGLRLLAVPLIRAYDSARAGRAEVAQGLAVARDHERGIPASQSGPRNDRCS